MVDYGKLSKAELENIVNGSSNTRTIGGEIARGIPIGLASLADIPPFLGNLPFYGASGVAKLAGYGEGKDLIEPFGYPSEYVRSALEKLSDVEGQPKTLAQQTVGTGVEFLSGGGGANLLSKIPKLANFAKLGAENISDYLKLGGSGGISGAVQNETDDPLLAAGAGLAIPAGAHGLVKGIKGGLNQLPTNRANINLNQNIGNDVEKALQNKQQANELGLNLTPAEASGNPILGAEQGTRGTSKEGSQKLYEFSKDQVQAQRKVIGSLLNEITPDTELFNNKARELSKNIIEGKKQVLREKATPFYQKSEKVLVGEKPSNQYFNDQNIKTKKAYVSEHIDDKKSFNPYLLEEKSITNPRINYNEQLLTKNDIQWPRPIEKDPKIIETINKVWNDKKYQVDLTGYEKNSIKTLDLAKRVLDDEISTLQRKGANNAARVITNSRNRLVKEMDASSPDYKKARSIYSEDLPSIKALEDSAIGKIANMNDEQIKNVSRTIFDSTVKDPKRLNLYRDEIVKDAPEIWYGLVRNDMESRISKGKVTGSKFYKNILEDENLYKHYQSALRDNPEALKKLHMVKNVFENLIPHKTVKTSAAQAKSSLDVARNSTQLVGKIADNLIGGAYDNAAIDLIIGNKWDQKFNDIGKIKDPIFKRKQLIGVLESINKEKQEMSESSDIDYQKLSKEELERIVNSQ